MVQQLKHFIHSKLGEGHFFAPQKLQVLVVVVKRVLLVKITILEENKIKQKTYIKKVKIKQKACKPKSH